MVRLSLSLVLAVVLTLAGAAIAYDAITQRDIFPLVGSAFAIGLGLTWLRAVIKEWRAKA
jgi:fucose permease